jgi:hypothetical protein
MSTSWETTDVFAIPMEICWRFDYAIDSAKLKNLYSKSKRLQWDAEQDLDWSTPIDPSKPILDESRNGLDRIPILQRLSGSQRQTFIAHYTAHLLSQFLHGEQGALMMPALVRVGAVTERTRALYAEAGIPVHWDLRVLESLEDAETGELDGALAR